jgi:steroid delta-isomerase-like uncharacterized protein
MTANGKIISRRFFEEILGGGDLDLVEKLFTADYSAHTPIGVFEGLEGAKQFVTGLRAAFPDLEVSVEDQVIEGDRVANLWSARGTHRDNFGGIPATGRKMETSGITMFRIADGKVLESWGFADMMGMMKQLGVVPAPGKSS